MRQPIHLQCIPTPVMWVGRFLHQETIGAALTAVGSAGVPLLAQRLQIPWTFRVRKVELYLARNFAVGEVFVRFTTAAGLGGVGIPGVSELVIPSSSASWIPFFWTGAGWTDPPPAEVEAPVLPAGDVWLGLYKLVGDYGIDWYYGSTPGGALFQDGTRCAYVWETPRPDDDFCFRIYGS